MKDDQLNSKLSTALQSAKRLKQSNGGCIIENLLAGADSEAKGKDDDGGQPLSSQRCQNEPGEGFLERPNKIIQKHGTVDKLLLANKDR